MKKELKSIVNYFAVIPLVCMLISMCLVLSFLPKKYRYKNRFYFFVTSFFSRVIVFFCFIKYKIYDNRNLLSCSKNPYIFIINHTSFIDVPMVEIILRSRPRIWISRKILGMNTLLKRMHVVVKREAISDVKGALKQAIDIAKENGSDIVLFPEGTRHADGSIHDFFSGFAIIAKELNLDVVPIAISGLNKIFPPNSFFIDSNAQKVKISIGEPISYKNFSSHSEFVIFSQNWFKQELEKLNSY